MEYLTATLIILLIIKLFNKQKRNVDVDYKLLNIRKDIEIWFSTITLYMKEMQGHQKLILELKESINMLNAHFIMTNAEMSRHFPTINQNQKPSKVKLSIVKTKKETITKKQEKKNEEQDK